MTRFAIKINAHLSMAAIRQDKSLFRGIERF
jgi:hypothetical protein